VWAAADHKHAFTITRESGGDGLSSGNDPCFVARVSRLDGFKQHQIGRDFQTFEDAVRLCSIYTCEARRQVAYHEAGHAAAAWLLGFTGVWIDMDDGAGHAIVRHDLLPSMLAVADGGRAALARYLYEDLMFSVAGLVAEAKIAGYRTSYVEEDVAGRTSIGWGAVRVARIEAGLPVCGHQDCEIPFAVAGSDSDGDAATAGRVTEADVAEVIRRAEDEAFALLKANWAIVERVAGVLCEQDRITTAELDALIGAGKRRSTTPTQCNSLYRGLTPLTETI
jgi:ATP-dependent Zn protease